MNVVDQYLREPDPHNARWVVEPRAASLPDVVVPREDLELHAACEHAGVEITLSFRAHRTDEEVSSIPMEMLRAGLRGAHQRWQELLQEALPGFFDEHFPSIDHRDRAHARILERAHHDIRAAGALRAELARAAERIQELEELKE